MCQISKQFSMVSNWWRALSCMLALCVGCTSIESTMVTRDDSNQNWERHNCLNGVPITLKVPTHLKLYVFEKHYLEPVKAKVKEPVLDDKGKPEKDDDGKPVEQDVEKVVGIAPVNMDVVVRDFANEFMYTDKIFVVDFKRPPAGTSNLNVDMTNDQYISHIQHDIQEDTIEKVSGLLGAFIGAGGLKSAGKEEETPPKSSGPALTEIKSLVAVGIFEIDAPDFEHKVKQFMDCHVNKAHDAWIVPPCVEGINRVGIRSCDNTQVPYPPVPLCPADGECPSPSSVNSSISSARDSSHGKRSVMK
jgi:hypothetical protein